MLAALVSLGAAPDALADVGNGDFESGDLTGWTTTGNVEVLSGARLTPNISAPGGTFFALLSSGPGTTGAGSSGEERDGSGFVEYEIATLSQTFDVVADSSLTFTIRFATSEVNANVDDFFEVLVDGTRVAEGSVPGVSGSPYADFGTLDGVDYTVNSPGPRMAAASTTG